MWRSTSAPWLESKKQPVPEFRQDPLTNRIVIVAPNRAVRPNAFAAANRGPRASAASAAVRTCPFCSDQMETPAPIATYGQEPGLPWRVCVVPNLFPALGDVPPEFGQILGQERAAAMRAAATSAAEVRFPHWFHPPWAAGGVHEVIIESPTHQRSLAELTPSQAAWVFTAYRDRTQALSQRTDVTFALPFKNYGLAAGASLEHIHSQIVGMPMLPDFARQRIEAAASYFRNSEACLFCRLLSDELAVQQRIVWQSDDFVMLAPFASRFPYELLILPRRHEARFERATDRQLVELSQLVQRLAAIFETDCQIEAYNFIVQTAPFDRNCDDHYHWHLEIIPRIVKAAGFEWGSGVHINPVAPEQAAYRLCRLLAR